MERPREPVDPNETVAASGDVYVSLHDGSQPRPPPPQGALPPSRRRWGTWAPARQSSISTLFRLASAVNESSHPTRGRRARTLNDTVGPRRTRIHVQRERRATTGQLPTVFRWVTTFVGQPVEETFWCQICFENVAVSEAFTLEPCGHQYCRICLATHLEQKIDDGDAYPVCFHPVLRDEDGENDRLHGRKTCGTVISLAAIEVLCGAEVCSRYEEQHEEDDDEQFSECPYCYHNQSIGQGDERDVACVACTRTFCIVHGSAHEDIACGDYELAAAKDHKIHHSSTAKNAKQCPTCKTSIEKTGTCNHMRCVVCTTSFCWLCGEHIDDGILPAHYDWTGESSCRGEQWDTTTQTTRSDRMLETAWRWVVAFFCIPMAALAAACVKSFACCRRRQTHSTFREVYTSARAACEKYFRGYVHCLVFVVFRYIVLLLCAVPALVLTVALKLVSCLCIKSWRRFINRDFVVVFKDVDLMLATIVFTCICAVAVGLVIVLGWLVRAVEQLARLRAGCCQPRISTTETIHVEKEQDQADLEAGNAAEATTLAIESPTSSPTYTLMREP